MGRLRIAAGALFVIALFAASALADGKFYWREPISPRIPYQRALILFDEGDQTLILQSSYLIGEARGLPAIGWVVPVPSVPKMGDIEPNSAFVIFHHLSHTSGPRIVIISDIVFSMLFFGFPGLVILYFLIYFFFYLRATFRKDKSWLEKHTPRIRTLAVLSIVMAAWIGMALLLGVFIKARGGDAIESVTVIQSERVGVYDVMVVSADDSGDLIAWLNEHEFEFDDGDVDAFDDYIARGWVFVVANSTPDEPVARIISARL